MIKKKVSIFDIAKSLGVSKTLISLVLNNKGDKSGISKITQKKVWDKVAEMNYVPNLMAKGLRLGRTNTIGLIVSDISNVFYSKIARNIEDYVSKAGYNLIICSTDENTEKEISLIKMLRERQVEGLIISSSQQSGVCFQAMLDEGFPFLLIDRKCNEIESNYVIVDNFDGAYNGIEMLIKKGYNKIAAFGISPEYTTSVNSRIDGYLKAIKASGLDYDRKYLKIIPFDNVQESVEKELDLLLQGDDKINAIFAVNNNIALACIEYLNKKNINIPTDVALLCFDDVPLFKLTNPQISAIAQPIEAICENAVDILVNEIIKKDVNLPKREVVLSTELIIRKSF